MGLGQLVGEAVAYAEADMARVEAAAAAIKSAIGKARPWLDASTWQGLAAADWLGQWRSLYASVQRCLDDLPAAEAQVVAQVQTRMEDMVKARTSETTRGL